MGLFADPNTAILKDIRSLLRVDASAQASQLEDLQAILRYQREIRRLLYRLARPARPGLLTVHTTGGNMADKITFDVLLPTLATSTDVVSRELTISLDGVADIRTAAPDQTSIDGFEGAQGAAVDLSLVDIDDGGLRSQASTHSVELRDNVPPGTPGELGIRVTGEIHEE